MCYELTGNDTGPAFREINNKGKLYPSVGMKKSGEHIRVNFGQSPFVFDIDGMMSASNNSSYRFPPPAARTAPSEDGSNVLSNGSASTDFEIVDYPPNGTATGSPHSNYFSEGQSDPALGDRLASSNPESLLLPPLITPPRPSFTIRTEDQEAQNNALPVDEQSRPLRLPSMTSGPDSQVPTDEGLIQGNPQEESSQVAEMRSAMQRLLAHNSPDPMSNGLLTGASRRTRISMAQYQVLRAALHAATIGPGTRISMPAHDSQRTGLDIAAGLYSRLRPVQRSPPITSTRPGDGNRRPRLAAIFRTPGLLTIRRLGVPNTTSQIVKPRDISTMTDFEIQQEKLQIRQDIEATSTSKIAPPMSETELIQSLVLQFLTHDGYVETARAFADEVHAEKKALSLDPDAVVHGFDVREDEDAGRRQSKVFPAGTQA